MSNKFFGRGNLGADPELRYTPGEDAQAVCALRVFFDRPKPDGSGGFEDKGGFWMNISYWGVRGEAAGRVLKKGARVAVGGELHEETWQDKETGEPRNRLSVRADTVDLDLSRIESLVWQKKTEHAA